MGITLNIFENIFSAIGGAYPVAKVIYAAIGSVLSAMLIYKTAYKIIGFFFTRKFHQLSVFYKRGKLLPAIAVQEPLSFDFLLHLLFLFCAP